MNLPYCNDDESTTKEKKKINKLAQMIHNSITFKMKAKVTDKADNCD